jgi:hypothetical protein
MHDPLSCNLVGVMCIHVNEVQIACYFRVDITIDTTILLYDTATLYTHDTVSIHIKCDYYL